MADRSGVQCAGVECAADGGGHEAIHGYEADAEGSEAHDAVGGPAEALSEEEQSKLAGGFRADAMQNTDEEDRLACIHPLKTLRLGKEGVPGTAQAPGGPEQAVDGDGQAALNAAVMVAMRILTQDAGYDTDAENDEGKADQPFRPVIQAFRQADELKNGDSNAATMNAWPRA
jgi:hypothetical protein